MDREARSQIIAITAVGIVVIMLAAFLWPGSSGVAFPSGPTMLYDEALVEEIYHRVSPAVVEIYADTQSGDFFNQNSAGSGFLIDSEGFIVTNYHVIERADRVRVSFIDGPNVEAKILGRNPANDLALLQVPKGTVAGIEPVKLGDSSRVKPGQLAIVIGNPYGLEGSVSVGVSSGVNRGLPSDLGRFIPGMIQTDALINPGNSGGPMLNRDGEVIGITTAIELSAPKINQRSIGFAVPSNTLADLLPRLVKAEVVKPPWLGTLSRNLNPLLVERLELPVDRGFYVIRVISGSPAQQAGLRASGVDTEGRPSPGGDIIIAVNGRTVASGTDLTVALNRYQAGGEITLTVVREGGETRVPVTLGEWPEG